MRRQKRSRVPRVRDGESTRGGFLPHKRGSGDLHRQILRFRKAVDAFLLHLECNFGL